MTEKAKPGQDLDHPRPPAPPPPPRWQRWLPLVGLILTLGLLLWPMRNSNAPAELSYTQFLSQVDGGMIATAEIDPSGAVTGTLTAGGEYKTQIPTALQDTGLADELKKKNVQITGKPQPGTTLLGLILELPAVPAVDRGVPVVRSAIAAPDRGRPQRDPRVAREGVRRRAPDHPIHRRRRATRAPSGRSARSSTS